jgi:GT2 family glycosyltransferase
VELTPVSVVIVTYGEQPLLKICVDAVLQSEGVAPEVIVVDNGHIGSELADLEKYGRTKIIRPGFNSGFAGGCNIGVRNASKDYVVLVNPDAIVAPDALSKLIRPLEVGDAQITAAVLVMLSEPDVINAAGNKIHPCGVSWCGSFRAPLAELRTSVDVLLASGAAMAMRRDDWVALGGFQEEFFAYYEDTELSLRVILRGGSIRLVHDAVVRHDYQFRKNASKMFLVDRNRMMLVLSLYRPRTYIFLLPVLVLHEAALLVFSLLGGWSKERFRALTWVAGHWRVIRRVRNRLQEGRITSDATLMRLMEMQLVPENMGLPSWAIHLQKPLQWIASLTSRAVGWTEKRFTK